MSPPGETKPGSDAAPAPTGTERPLSRALTEFALALGDDSLILGQRLSEWSGNAPFLEEDIALANIGLDYLGRAEKFYGYVSELEGGRRSVDEIAFLRDSRSYRNLLIFELPRGDFAHTMARQLMVDAFHLPYLKRLSRSSDQRIAAIAAEAVKESRYHLTHSREWVLRLGGGTGESRKRVQRAFNALWSYGPEMFEMSRHEEALLESGVSADRSVMEGEWQASMKDLLAEATLGVPEQAWPIAGGREGVHTEHHGYLLAEMQYMQRAYPGLQW